MPGPDGTVEIWALGVLPTNAGGGVRLTLGIPRDVLLADADNRLRQALAILAGASLLAFLTALTFAEMSIRRPLARITGAAARQQAGDFSARIDAPYPHGDLGDLMATLDATAQSVQVQQTEIERTSEQVRRTNRTLKMLSGINSTIVRLHNRDDLLAETCRIAVDDGQFPIVWAGLVNRGSRQLEPLVWRGVSRDHMESVSIAAADASSVVSIALRDQCTVVVNDIANDARVVTRKAALDVGSRSLAVFPLTVSGHAAGVLVLHAREVAFFDAAEVKLLAELAGDVAFALEYIEKSDRLAYLAYYDPLTGLANRVLFQQHLGNTLELAAREGGSIALVLADMERFRSINDTFGRSAGDDLLKQIAARATFQVSEDRALARIGADHFAFIVADEGDLDGFAARIDRIHREVFGKPVLVGGTELRVAARFGIARFPHDGSDADTLFRHAEAALKQAQQSGERYLVYAPKMTEQIAQRLTLENNLRLALENQEFVLHYQPKVDLETRRIVGIEALIRWQSPELGLVAPMRFIPLLEETGLILQVGAWALRQAALDHRAWCEEGLNPPRVAVNVSAVQLRQRDFVSALQQAISVGVVPVCIDLEITESLMMEDVADTIEKLNQVRKLGVSIAIDDFGTGYSSLAYLGKLPVQTLKIDRAFITTMQSDIDTMRMVSTIISLAHSLRLVVVAEGVETDEQAEMLRLQRCDQMQGYLFSRPVPAHELAQLLQRQA